MDLMATYAPTQLLLHSRLQTNGTAGVDVLNHNVSNIPGYFPHNRPSWEQCWGTQLRSQNRDRGAYLPSVVVSDDRRSRRPRSTNSVQGRGYPILRVQHQRGAEPYTLGRGGRRAVEVDFRRNIIIRRQPQTPQDAQHPRTDKRAYIRKVISVHSPRPLTPEPVHAAHTDDGNRNRPVRGNSAYARATGPHKSPTLAPIGHVQQPLQSIPTPTPHSTNLKGYDIPPGPRDTDNKHPSRTPLHVPDIRGRALNSKYYGENDDAFHFCQWSAALSTYDSRITILPCCA